jgi:hypothetical protein
MVYKPASDEEMFRDGVFEDADDDDEEDDKTYTETDAPEPAPEDLGIPGCRKLQVL